MLSPPCFLAVVVVVDTVEEGGGRRVCHVGRHVGGDEPRRHLPRWVEEYFVTVSLLGGVE